MLAFLPGPVRGVVAGLLVLFNTLFWAIPMIAATLVRTLLPLPSLRHRVSRFLMSCGENWVTNNNRIIDLTQRIVWDIQGVEELNPNGWYLLVSNHVSMVDIPVLQRVFHRRIPFIKFFLKQELFWVPVLGIIWWALDYPFMKRYSRAQIAKNPALAAKDLETTRKSCERFRYTPTTLLNFLEGTRFTQAKYDEQQPPYKHLLKPKSGGVAFAMAVMGDMFTSMLNITIEYPDGEIDFWGLLSGKVHKVVVRVEEMPIPTQFLHGDYANDPAFREQFQQWVTELWQRKDQLLSDLKGTSVEVKSS